MPPIWLDPGSRNPRFNTHQDILTFSSDHQEIGRGLRFGSVSVRLHVHLVHVKALNFYIYYFILTIYFLFKYMIFLKVQICFRNAL